MKKSELLSISWLKDLEIRSDEISDNWMRPNDPSFFTGEVNEGGTVEEVLGLLDDSTLKPIGIVKGENDDGPDFRVMFWKYR